MKNRLRSILLTAILAGVWASAGWSGDGTMPVSQIKPGMVGVGRTVFAGHEIETFDFEVLDIIPNFRAKRDLILVKLVGEKVSHTNVVAGMSGSPMYIDGKLVGALAYSMGIFMKDPIAGITPISQMFEILDREKMRSDELALRSGTNWDYIDMAVGAKDISLDALVPPNLLRLRSERSTATEIRQLDVPLLFSGFEPRVVEMSSQLFGGMGFQIGSGGGVVSTRDGDATPFAPGSAYAVVLVDGDLGLQATGTVTYVDNDKILGMGHPFLNGGAVGLPMGKARILTTISSLMSSTKMSALTEVVGTVHQDRTTGVLGIDGEVPPMVPLNLTMQSPLTQPITFNFRVAEDRSLHSLTPLIFSIVVTNALESARLSSGSQTLKLDGTIKLSGGETLPVKNYFAGGGPGSFLTDGVQAAGELASVIGALLSNSFVPPKIEAVDLTFEVLPRKSLAYVDRLMVDRNSVKPGEIITLTVHLKEYQGEAHKVTHKMTVPRNLRGRRLNIFAGSGATLTRLETRNSPRKFRPKNFEQLLELLNDRRKNNLVFFQMRLPDKGIMVEGEELPGLPPSILSVMQAQKSAGTVVNLRDRVVTEQEIETEYAVSGGRSVWLTVERK